jgi:hypothetical protein
MNSKDDNPSILFMGTGSEYQQTFGSFQCF